MRKNQGATFVEMSLALSLTALVLGVLTTLYGFSVQRLAHATASFGASNDAFNAADRINQTVRDAYSCTTVTLNGMTGLKCTMPADGTDRDGDGRLDTYSFSSVSRRGLEKVAVGKRVWHYLSNNTGAFGNSGTIFWRAERSDDLNPTSADADTRFAYSSPTKVRYPLITGLTFAVDANAQTVAFSVTAGTLTRAERTPGAGEATNQSYTQTETRTAFWRNWRK